MRQRTKVAEWWERRQVLRDGARVDITTFKDEASARRAKKRGTLHHVTRYKLAPLVKLTLRRSWEYPEWDAVEANGTVHATVYPRGWSIWGHHQQSGDAPNFNEAKAACAARLRELGYRVVDE